MTTTADALTALQTATTTYATTPNAANLAALDTTAAAARAAAASAASGDSSLTALNAAITAADATIIAADEAALTAGAITTTAATDESGVVDDYTTDATTHAKTAVAKHYQISVPDFAINESTQSAMSSFLRIGTGLTMGDSPTPTDGHPIKRAEQASLELAKLVGDATAIGNAENLTVEKDGSKWPSPFGGDTNFLLGFGDDTRYRDDNTDNPRTDRQAETKRLLTKGGWWDHSDGNRVTTTTGDKIEVIQGNYKMVVLGRTDGPSDISKAFITDVSGGHFQEQYASPTPCIKTIEWTKDTVGGSWTLTQDNGKGNVTTYFYGVTVDAYAGPRRETYVGYDADHPLLPPTAKADSLVAATLTKPAAVLDPTLVSYTWATKIYSQVGSEKKPIGGGNTLFDGNLSSESSDSGATGDRAGDITSKTWAQRIRNYVGSVSTPVTHSYSLTYVNATESYTFGESIVSVNAAINNMDVTLGIKESVQVGIQGSLFVGGQLNINLSGRVDISPKRFALSMGEDGKITNDHTSLAENETRLANIETKLTQTRTALCTAANELFQEATSVGQLVTYMTLEMSLGI